MNSFTDCFDFNKNLSLYIHVPFCTSKCSYCAFYSKSGCTEENKNIYTERVVKEIRNLNSSLKKPYYTAFIGGGNPGCLNVKQMAMIAEAVCEYGRPVEFTTEMNPENLSLQHFPLFENFFNRLSMGVQSLNERALSFLGRNSTLEQTLNGIALSQKLREKTGCILSYDLITCLPEWHDSERDIEKLITSYTPEHLSLYALTLEENTPLFKSKPILPDSDEQERILSLLWDKLQTYGFTQYEVSNFARDGKISLHNSVYWDYFQYSGIGPGATSTGFNNEKTFRIEATESIFDWNYEVSELTEQESFEEFVIMGLRHTKGLDLNRLKTEFGRSLKKIPEGFSIKDDYLVPDRYGLMTADYAASVLLY